MIDDSGTAGTNPQDRFFVLTATVTNNPEKIIHAVDRVPRNAEGDRKFADCKRIHPHKTLQAMKRIDSYEPDIYLRIVDNSDLTDPRNGKTIYRQTMEQLIQDILYTDPSTTIYVCPDQSTQVPDDILENMCTDERIKDAKSIVDPKDARGHIADFVAGSTGLAINKKSRWRRKYFNQVKGRVKRSHNRRVPKPVETPPGFTRLMYNHICCIK